MRKILISLWFLSLFLIPFDNFPFFKSGFIKPLAVFPLFFLVFLFLILVLAGKEKLRLNKLDIAFLIFVFLIFLNSLIQLLLLPPDLLTKGMTSFQRFLEIFYFLPLLLIFYFCPRIIIDSKDKLKKTFKWLILAFVFPIFWGLLQSVYVFSGASWQGSFFREIERLLVTRGGVFGSRISLFSAEPSWAATQILLLVLPILFFCFYFKFSFFKKINLNFDLFCSNKKSKKVIKFSLETVFFFLALFCLIMTFSVTAYIAAIFFLLLYFCMFLKKKRFYRNALKTAFVVILFFLIALPLLPGFLGRVDVFSSISSYDFLSIFQKEESFLVRSAGWIVGFREVFSHPLLGVGFRNTMFYYRDLIPEWSQSNRIVQAYADPNYLSLIPTPKGFLPGILGETGLVGFALFLIFYLAILRKIIMLKLKDRLTAVVKYSILFSLFLIILLGLSLDFTYPYFWLVLGLASSISNIYTDERRH